MVLSLNTMRVVIPSQHVVRTLLTHADHADRCSVSRRVFATGTIVSRALAVPARPHTAQPLSCSSEPPHSGQAPERLSRLSTCLVTPDIATPVSAKAVACSRTMPTASGHDSTLPPSAQHGEGQRIPRRCLMMAAGSTPARSDTETILESASDCEAAHPPDLPIWVNNSHMPYSSQFTVT